MKTVTKVAMVVAVGLLACFAQPAAADTVTLASLIGGGSITSGDKTFSNFMYSTTGTGMPAATDVNVSSITEFGAFGIRISGAFHATGGLASDALLMYTVTSQGNDITGAIMHGNPNVKGPDGGTMSVTETFQQSPTNKIKIFDIEPGNNILLTDQTTFNTPEHSIVVEKDIMGLSNAVGSTADLSFIDQLFPQGGHGTTPEPASLMLLGIGALGLLGYRRYSAR